MTVPPQAFLAALMGGETGVITGVPDSVLKDLCAHISTTVPRDRHLIAANEGGAIAYAVGAWMATGETPVVYMQNSGLGNAVNPLMSLAHQSVAAVPMILIIGWRGQPDHPDEPQHLAQGAATPALLEALGLPWRELPPEENAAVSVAGWARETAQDRQGPVAILVPRGTFGSSAQSTKTAAQPIGLASRAAIRRVLDVHRGPVVASTGYTGREVLAVRAEQGAPDDQDFLNVGAMGHASQIALGLATQRPELDVLCLDGDGAALMHLGAWAINGTQPGGRMLHVVLNNGMHASVGGQPTVGHQIDFCTLATACGYDAVEQVSTLPALDQALTRLQPLQGMRLLEIRTLASQGPLPRPETPIAQATRRFQARFSPPAHDAD